SQDDRGFPTKGLLLQAHAKLIDILDKYDDGKTVQLKVLSQLSFPITSWLTYRLGLSGGLTIGEVLNPYYRYRLGGIFEQNLGNFMQFSGYQFGQESGENILVNSNVFQFNVYKNYFADVSLNLANVFND